MTEVLHNFGILYADDGTAYRVRACGSEMDDIVWEGWLEFEPLNDVEGAPPLRSPRETTQPNRTDTIYWATGLTPVYLEGALQRALHPRVAPAPPPAEVSSVLNPFSVYQKGEELLRDQLRALAPWHLINIIVAYDLSEIPQEELRAMPAPELIELIVASVRMSAANPRVG
jgi:hypothetical protein